MGTRSSHPKSRYIFWGVSLITLHLYLRSYCPFVVMEKGIQFPAEVHPLVVAHITMDNITPTHILGGLNEFQWVKTENMKLEGERVMEGN